MKYQIRRRSISSILLIITAIIFIFSLITHHPKDHSLFYYDDNQDVKNILGLFGAHISALLFYCFGGVAYYVSLLLGFYGYMRLRDINLEGEWDRILCACFYIFFLPCFLSYYTLDIRGIMPGGLIGQQFLAMLVHSSHDILYMIFLFVVTSASFIIMTRLSLIRPISYLAKTQVCYAIKCCARYSFSTLLFIADGLRNKWAHYIKGEEIAVHVSENDMLWAALESLDIIDDNQTNINDPFWQEFKNRLHSSNHENDDAYEKDVDPTSIQVRGAIVSEKMASEPTQESNKKVRYRVPPISLLAIQKKSTKINDEELKERAFIVEEKLRHFGVKGEVISMTPGPVITLFEFQPAIDIKVSRILALEDDLALALKAHSLRIIAPIPGKSVVGFEVANINREVLYLAPLIISESFKNDISHVPIVLGHDTIGNPVITDLTSAPHLLIAGSTGSGKSVALNVMLTSMLYKCKPEELRLVLIDPKRLEFAAYADIPHLLCPIVTHPSKAVLILKWVLKTMEQRYELMAAEGVRNIHDYKRLCEQQKNNDDMPFIVVVIDELADLMLVAGADIENLLARIAQMARAAGIHLIVATQRPSVDVITGVVKVNFPSRVAFKVASKIDSRTILDSSGAEKLLGKGDMLYLSPSGSLVRLHGAYISSEETIRVVEYIKKESPAQYVINFDELVTNEESATNDDPIYNDVVSYVKTIDEISISQLQRRFRIGYNRSARIIEMLETNNMITPADGSKMRKVIR